MSIQLHITYWRLGHHLVVFSSIGWHRRVVSRLMGQESKNLVEYLTVLCIFTTVLRSEYLKSKLFWEVQYMGSPWIWGLDSSHRFPSPQLFPQTGEPSIHSTTVYRYLFCPVKVTKLRQSLCLGSVRVDYKSMSIIFRANVSQNFHAQIGIVFQSS